MARSMPRTKHEVEGYSESLDHELRTRGIRVSVIEQIMVACGIIGPTHLLERKQMVPVRASRHHR
jgi:short-subunit dehydrogenase